MTKRVKSLFLFFVTGLVLVTCNKKKEGQCEYGDNKSKLFIKIIDNKGNKVQNARINIFESFEKYQTAIVYKNNPLFALDSVYSDSTKAVNLFIDPYNDHWILVSYYDSTQLKYLSSELTTSKIDKLISCSDYHFTIILEPVGANVSFWTPSGINLPIDIKLDNKLDSLLDSTLVAPINLITPAAPKQTSFAVKAGTYQYQATSKQGCSWQGEFTVTDGEYLPIKLEPCQRAFLAFYFTSASAIPTPKQTLTIFIDNNPASIATLNGPTVVAPVNSCNSPSPVPNAVYVFLEPGVSHTYKVVSGPGVNGIPCIWTGTTPILSTDCSLNTPIFLGTGCN